MSLLITRRLLLAGFACFVAQSAAAQSTRLREITFQGIRWGTQADSLRPRLDSLGFTFDRTLEGGSQLYSAADGRWLTVYRTGERLTGFALRDAPRGEAAQARYRVLIDSLAAAIAVPDEINEEEDFARERLWVIGLTSVTVEARRIGTDGYVDVTWRGPGWYDEAARISERPTLPAGFTTVAMNQLMRIAVDTTVRTARGAPLRGRFRMEYPVAVTPAPTPAGQEEPFDAVEYEMEFDCEQRRTRLIARTTYLEGNRIRANRPQNQGWARPQRDGHYDRGLDAVCRVARGR